MEKNDLRSESGIGLWMKDIKAKLSRRTIGKTDVAYCTCVVM